ncbi:Brp/Blh family beta-carotene 15,15'-dioxygenase [Mangrovivirga cuniculi]|uniref:Beta-carotene 15,15'-dioxygenase n=1 Tax=Mangrovivirga cuniculi TaxID=2715131 RepID=A0A4D7JIE9_9BACT|nr:Brp/Blh family beta-carotene 15,15'-dioxygenase [Mangrovivirga cuniculi]QCK15769.1 hypothetical protein DCC35_13955 [Mangrovivirga cuniculi]
MNLSVFIYIAFNLVFLNLIQIQNDLFDSMLTGMCLFAILTLGISHGAVDNLLYGAKGKKQNIRFIINYILIAIGFGVIWWFVPNLAFILFILFSAYHFGQSQFVDLTPDKGIGGFLLDFLWGLSLISGLIYLNAPEASAFAEEYFKSLSSFILMIEYSGYLTAGFLTVTLILLIKNRLNGFISNNELLRELYLIALIGISFKLFDLLLGFTLYFIILHSLKVLRQEFSYFKIKSKLKNVFQFMKLLLPFTLISILGIILIFIIVSFFERPDLIPFLGIVLISCITIPHAFVMEIFYENKFHG